MIASSDPREVAHRGRIFDIKTGREGLTPARMLELASTVQHYYPGTRRIIGHGGEAAPRRQQFFHDENPPHVHIKGPDYVAKISISDGEALAGRVPSKVLREARQWISDTSDGLQRSPRRGAGPPRRE